ncbi:hypothetical protein [Sporichthya polymorpha]|uniref:hypothetical protein n=1 Tax=Sporichthya polymorpha TaxID=35751 RepID=UPI00037F7F6E|nr:hypothetical protein [Sporichthya polymorpha]
MDRRSFRARIFGGAGVALLGLTGCGIGGDSVVPSDAGPDRSPIVEAPLSPSAGAPSPSARPAPVGDPAERIPVRLPLANWHLVDSALASTVSVTTEDPGDELPKASKASAVIELAEGQLAKLGEKPAEDRSVTIVLSRAQWAFVLEELRDWLAVAESMPDEPEVAESVPTERETIALIERQVAKAQKVLAGPRAPGTATRAGTRHFAEAFEHQVWLAPFDAYPVDEKSWLKEQVLGVSGGAVVIRTGVSWGNVDLTVRAFAAAPAPLSEGLGDWDVGEEETFEITEPLHAFGPLGLWWAENAFVPARPGLYRVRVLASGRVPDNGYDEVEGRSGERYEVSFWPVTNRAPHLRYGDDRLSSPSYAPYSDTGEDYGDE